MIKKFIPDIAVRFRSACIAIVMIHCEIILADGHIEILDTLVVTSPLHQQTSQTALPVTILSGEELRLKSSNTLGATLDQEPGISNSSFGPGVGRPVIRGQGGPRVRILQGGTGTLDVSSLSPDHAVSTEAILADRIEVLRGPSTLLYGNGAIGGVVNVIDNRIPDTLPDGMEFSFEQRFSTVSDEKATVAKFETAAGPIALHLDGLYRDRNNMDIDGFALNREVFGDNDFNTKGFVENSNARTKSGTVGLSFVGGQGFGGLSTNYLESNYGIPMESADETVRIDSKQLRYDVKGESSKPMLFWDSIKGYITYNDYEHTEIENGVASTKFENEAYEGRLEISHQPLFQDNHGVIGAQIIVSDFSALGQESFVPKTDSQSYGLFVVEDFHFDDWIFEAGFRIEQVEINPADAPDQDYTPISASISALREISGNTSFSLSLSRSQRAPAIEELFSNGAHLATQSFELGDSGLEKETSHNIEIGVNSDLEWMNASINVFYNQVDNYVFLDTPGNVFNLDSEIFETICSGADCLPVRQYRQRDATFKGFEGQVNFPLFYSSYGDLDIAFFGDYVRGKLDGAGDVPRLPPLRYGFRLRYSDTDWQARFGLTRGSKQNHAGKNENDTEGYLLFNAGFDYHLDLGGGREMLFFVNATNLFDEEVRNATSILRDVSPEPGRGVLFGLRMDL